MRDILYSLERHPALWIQPAVVFLITLGIAYLVRRIFFGALHRWSRHSTTRAITALQDALRGPTHIWNFILAIHFAIQSSALPHRFTERAPEVLQVLFIASLTLMFMRVAGDMVRNFGDQIPGAVPVTTLSQNLAQLAVLILGILVGLRVIGIEVTPILTALGVGGIAVALALQDTLSNLFAGFYITLARQIRPGDYIKLTTGEEGYVTDISWRATALRNLNNNMVIVPNAKLAQSNVTNYYLPEKRMGASVQVNVAYDSDIDQVERVLREVGMKAVAEIPGMAPEPAPEVTLDPGFGESSLGFTLGFQIAEFSKQYKVRHEIRKRILHRFREEGIAIPFPTRSVWMHDCEVRNPQPQVASPPKTL
jgi:small-conductance mechanosensitive channel